MNLDELTLGQVKELTSMISNNNVASGIDNYAINKIVIIRTYSAGVWCGTLMQKSGNEVILKNARRMWRWWTNDSVSLSAVANTGINQDKSKIAPEIETVWLEAIEIIPITKIAEKSIFGAENAKTE